jgi:hypothetical protein
MHCKLGVAIVIESILQNIGAHEKQQALRDVIA